MELFENGADAGVKSACLYKYAEGSAAAENHEDDIRGLHTASVKGAEESKEACGCYLRLINHVIGSVNCYISHSSRGFHLFIVVCTGWNDP